MGNATREFESTVDQSDIRGLVIASQRLVAGLPRSSGGDRRVDAHIIRLRGLAVTFGSTVRAPWTNGRPTRRMHRTRYSGLSGDIRVHGQSPVDEWPPDPSNAPDPLQRASPALGGPVICGVKRLLGSANGRKGVGSGVGGLLSATRPYSYCRPLAVTRDRGT